MSESGRYGDLFHFCGVVNIPLPYFSPGDPFTMNRLPLRAQYDLMVKA